MFRSGFSFTSTKGSCQIRRKLHVQPRLSKLPLRFWSNYVVCGLHSQSVVFYEANWFDLFYCLLGVWYIRHCHLNLNSSTCSAVNFENYQSSKYWLVGRREIIINNIHITFSIYVKMILTLAWASCLGPYAFVRHILFVLIFHPIR